jgi:hypothetical protein
LTLKWNRSQSITYCNHSGAGRPSLTRLFANVIIMYLELKSFPGALDVVVWERAGRLGGNCRFISAFELQCAAFAVICHCLGQSNSLGFQSYDRLSAALAGILSKPRHELWFHCPCSCRRLYMISMVCKLLKLLSGNSLHSTLH